MCWPPRPVSSTRPATSSSTLAAARHGGKASALPSIVVAHQRHIDVGDGPGADLLRLTGRQVRMSCAKISAKSELEQRGSWQGHIPPELAAFFGAANQFLPRNRQPR